MTYFPADSGTPEWWELALIVVPALVGVVYFAYATWRDHKERDRREHKNPQATSENGGEHDGARPVQQREIVQMEHAATDLSWLGLLLMVEAVLVIFIVLHHFGAITDHYVALIFNAKHHSVETLMMLAVRTAAYGTVISTALYVLIRFAGANFDQATRFRKRTHSAHVLAFVLREYGEQIKSRKVTLGDAVAVFKAWNENVESAFTNAKLVKDKQESVGGNLSPLGSTFVYGPLQNGRSASKDGGTPGA